MDLGIKNKLALVTGSSRGIGQAIAIELAREGARVVLVALDAKKLKEVQRSLPGGARRHPCYVMNLLSSRNTTRLANTLLTKHGAPEIIVHNLGGSAGVRDTFAPVSDWKNVWHFNLGIVIELNRLLIPPMIKKKWGRIVHLSTLSTLTFRGYAPYVSAKAALDAYVKTMGQEVAKHNIVLSAVSPGAIYTEGRYFAKIMKEDPAAAEHYFREHLPAYRFGTAKEIGRVAAFLCSDQAAFMTGSIVRVDGGGM